MGLPRYSTNLRQEAPAGDVLRDVIPVVEGKVYAWSKWIREKDSLGAPVSGAYDVLQEYGITGGPVRPKKQVSESQQERWIQKEIVEIDIVIRRTLRKIAQLERQIFWLRYVERKTWGEMEGILNYSESQIKSAFRERLLYALAMEFGLLSSD